MASCPGSIRLAKEPSQPLTYEGVGCDAGDSSHFEILIEVGNFRFIKNYNVL